MKAYNKLTSELPMHIYFVLNGNQVCETEPEPLKGKEFWESVPETESTNSPLMNNFVYFMVGSLMDEPELPLMKSPIYLSLSLSFCLFANSISIFKLLCQRIVSYKLWRTRIILYYYSLSSKLPMRFAFIIHGQ